MGIYSSKTMTTDIDNFDEEFITREGFEPEMMPMYTIFMESCDDDLAIMEAIHAYDMAEIEGTRKIARLCESMGDDSAEVDEAEEELEKALEAEGESILTKIKEALKKFWNNVKNFFTGLIDKIKARLGNTEAFLKTYGPKLKDAKFEAFKVKGYKFNIDAISAKYGTTLIDEIMSGAEGANDMVSEIKGAKSNEELGKMEREARDQMKSSTADVLSAYMDIDVTEENIASELFDFFHGAGAYKNGKVEISVSSIGEYVAYLEKSKELLAGIEKARRDTDTTFRTITTLVNGLSNELRDPSDKLSSAKIRVLNTCMKGFNASHRASIRFINAWQSAANEYGAFCRGMCLKALAASKKGAKAEA